MHDDRYVTAANLSEGWLQAVNALVRIDGHKAVHFVVRITDPTVEVAHIRGRAQELIDDWNSGKEISDYYHDIETTRNTLFPSVWARRHADPQELVSHYRSHYTTSGLRGLRANATGTYFGRIVAYPRGEGEAPADQLGDTIRKVREELNTNAPKSSRYEISIYHEATDRSPMGFPCLAHLSVHLHERALNLHAVYRNEALISRAYGNYLGLAELLRYLSKACDIAVGELMVTAGHVELDGRMQAVRRMLADLVGQSS